LSHCIAAVSNVYILSSLFLPSLPDCVDDGEGAAGAARAGSAAPQHAPRRVAAGLLTHAHAAQDQGKNGIIALFLILFLTILYID
jgi:hypothetical protein